MNNFFLLLKVSFYHSRFYSFVSSPVLYSILFPLPFFYALLVVGNLCSIQVKVPEKTDWLFFSSSISREFAFYITFSPFFFVVGLYLWRYFFLDASLLVLYFHFICLDALLGYGFDCGRCRLLALYSV